MTELVVIIAGVLIALAAHRWNQIRLQPAAADEYLNRLDTAPAVDLDECRTTARTAMATDSSVIYVPSIFRKWDVPRSESRRFVQAALTAS